MVLTNIINKSLPSTQSLRFQIVKVIITASSQTSGGLLQPLSNFHHSLSLSHRTTMAISSSPYVSR